MAFMAFSQNKR